MPSSNTPPTDHHHLGLRVIAAFKFLEVLCFLVATVAAFGLGVPRNLHHLLHWLQGQSILGTDLGRQVIDYLSGLGPQRFTALGIVTLCYAILFAIECVGLWLRKPWAEWLTVFATGSLIPFEAYELFSHFGYGKLAILLVNLVIVIYLIRVALLAAKSKPLR